MYEELVQLLKDKAERFDYDGWVDTAVVMEKAADAIEELSRVADAIPHVCECCVGCEVESGGCDRAFVLSPKRAMEYLSKPRWIPVEERLPELPRYEHCSKMVIAKVTGFGVMPMKYERTKLRGNVTERWRFYWDRVCTEEVTHWMPLPEPPKENGKSET